MPIVANDLIEVMSGGASNTTAANSLGGNPSTQAGGQITDNTTHNIWDVVSSSESSGGDIEYRCIFIKNNHGSLSLTNAKVWIQTQTPSANTSVQIGLGTSAVGTNPNEQGGVLANEQTAPTGVTFSTAVDEANALSIGTLPSQQHKAIWIRRTIDAGAAAANDDSYVLAYSGDTAA